MAKKTLLILERSSQNLQKITRNGKTMLEGVFAEFGIENRNGRIYEEKEYLPHLEYLKKDIANGNLLGELDHPERFEVALGSVSHRISELWYDQSSRQVKGRIEILEGTPKGQIAKSLLEAGVPLSISSRAAGTVNEDKTVAIQQIYTYDLVAKPGFEAAQLHQVNENASPKQLAEIDQMIKSLNESSHSRQEHSLNSKFGLLNDNISIIDLSDKFPQLNLREEAKALQNNKNKNNTFSNMSQNESTPINEEAIQNWTKSFNDKLTDISRRLDEMEKTDNTSQIPSMKRYIEKLRKIQEDSLNWQSEIAVAVNEVATYADTLANKSNKHYNLTKKIVETVDHNAKTLNATQDWTTEIAKTTNAIGETVDHNAKMLNGVNEWTTQIAKGVNGLNEWSTEKAVAINDMHDWVSTQAKVINKINEWNESIAKNLNNTVNWSEDMFGRAISKEDALKLIEYVDLVSESKSNPDVREKINEMLRTHSITKKPLNESQLKGIKVIDTVGRVGNTKVDTDYDDNSGVEFDEKTGTIISKLRNIRMSKGKMPIGNEKLQMNTNEKPNRVGSDGMSNDPTKLKSGLKNTKTIGSGKESVTGYGPKSKNQNLKLNTLPEGKLKESADIAFDIQTRKTNLDNKLGKIMESLEKERGIDENIKSQYPFTQLLSADDRKRFANLDATDKQKVVNEVSKVPTTDAKVIIKLWENAVSNNKSDEPLWLKLAPKVYKDAYTKGSNALKESINAKSEYMQLNTQYQINNFWETCGIITKPNIILNEAFIAKTSEETEQKLDTFVAGIGEMMNRYKNV
jgi:uncharacterized protein YoxC